MFYRLLAITAVCLGALAALSPSSAQAPAGKTKLAWKFTKDTPFYQEMTIDTVQNMVIQGSKVDNVQKQTFYFVWTPKEQDKEGNWVIKQKIAGVKMDFSIGGSKVSFDSTKESTGNNPLSDFFKQLVDSEFTITLDKSYKATKIEGGPEFLKKLTGQNPQMEALLKQILNEESLKEMAVPSFASFPEKDLNANESWSSAPSKLDMGPIGKYEVGFKYTYEGKSKDKATEKLDKIKVEPSLKYTEPADTASGLPFRIKKADLKTTKSAGTILFDSDKGRIDSYETEVELKGPLSVEIAGMVTAVELSQSQKTTIKTMEKNPIEKKP